LKFRKSWYLSIKFNPIPGGKITHFQGHRIYITNSMQKKSTQEAKVYDENSVSQTSMKLTLQQQINM
jgi:hypothetical protein